MVTLRTARQRREAPRARIDHLIRSMGAVARWRGKDWGAVLRAITEGLAAEEQGGVVAAALTLVEVWGLRVPPAFFHTLPPLEDRRAWAALTLALTMLDRFAEVERRAMGTPPTGPDPAA